jgi:hypothetical protein
VPQRKKDDEMLRRNHGVLCLDQSFRETTVLEILLRSKDWEIETRHLDPDYLMPASGGTFRVGTGERMTEAIAGRIGMTLDNRHPSWHSWVSSLQLFARCSGCPSRHRVRKLSEARRTMRFNAVSVWPPADLPLSV